MEGQISNTPEQTIDTPERDDIEYAIDIMAPRHNETDSTKMLPQGTQNRIKTVMRELVPVL